MATDSKPTEQLLILAREASKEKEEDPEKILSLAEQIDTHGDEKRNSPRPPDWIEVYQLAVTEFDPAKLRQRVSDARNAILDRVAETRTKPFPNEERQQLSDALNVLRVIQQEYERSTQRYGELLTA